MNTFVNRQMTIWKRSRKLCFFCVFLSGCFSNLDFRRIISRPPPPLAQSTAVSLKQPFDGYYLLII